MANLTLVQAFGNQLKAIFDDDSYVLLAPTPTGMWVTAASSGGGPTPGTGLIDNISPGHVFAEGDVVTDWQWHVDNASGRGGNDLNFIFEDFYAPGDGTLSHFDVSGVGMVVKLILDTPAVRTKPAYPNDAAGPVLAIWYEHCSASMPDGHYTQGQKIGTSGDGYGTYPAHLHVHGLIDTGDTAGSTNRSCFFNFV